MLSGLLLLWTLTLLYGGGSNLAIVKYTPANAQVLCNHYIEMCCRCRTAVGSNAQHIVNALNVDRRSVAELRKLCRGSSQDFRYDIALFLRVACNQQVFVVEAVFADHICHRLQSYACLKSYRSYSLLCSASVQHCIEGISLHGAGVKRRR